jgi:hypothetical protein
MTHFGVNCWPHCSRRQIVYHCQKQLWRLMQSQVLSIDKGDTLK